MTAPNRSRGFTLVEVMVALAIVAIALPALLMAVYQQADDTAYLRDKMLAEMVAVNQLTQIRLVVASTRSLTPGKDNGVAKFADRDWYWWAETKTTEVEKYYRIDITVALTEEQRAQPLYTLSAFMSGDLEIDREGFGGSGGNNGSDTEVQTGSDGNQTGNVPNGGAGDGIGLGGQLGVDPATGRSLTVPTDGR